jgi:hypothetical protein
MGFEWMSVKWTIRGKGFDKMYLQGNGLLAKRLIGETSFHAFGEMGFGKMDFGETYRNR